MTDRQLATPANSRASTGLTTVRVDEHAGTAVVAIRGHIDAGTATLIRDALAWAVSCHARVVVDLSAAESIDRAGLSVIIAAQDRAGDHAVQMCFSAPSPQLLTALCAMRASEMLATVDAPAVRTDAWADGGAGFTLPRVPQPLQFDGVAA
jgi:anti-sigma B factor antagonist